VIKSVSQVKVCALILLTATAVVAPFLSRGYSGGHDLTFHVSIWSETVRQWQEGIVHARYCWLLLAESQLARRLFGSMVGRIASLPLPAGEASRRPEQISATREAREGKVAEESVGKTATSGLGILRRGKTDPFRGSWNHPALKGRLDLEFRGARVYITGRAKLKTEILDCKARATPRQT
jgi:hypothetical protein